MSEDLSKLCADYLRMSFTSKFPNIKLKASHARELVAAFFGYKSHAALIAEKHFQLDNLSEARILVPDIPLMEHRRTTLKDLPESLPSSRELAGLLSIQLETKGHFRGDVWLYESLETYVTDVLIHSHDATISDHLSGVMAETNATFFMPWFQEAEVEDSGDELVVIATGKYEGEPLGDKPFCGDTIDTTVRVTLPRVAGRRGFNNFELDVSGEVNDDWVDPKLKYGFADKPQSRLAEELGVSEDDLALLEWDVLENTSEDGLVYDFVLIFDESNPPEILGKIDGLSDELTIHVSTNAFDEPVFEDFL